MAGTPQFHGGRGFERVPDITAGDVMQRMESYRALVSRVVGAFGDEIKASRWLSQPNADLGGQTPLQALQTSGYNFQVLEPILIRIEHGVDY